MILTSLVVLGVSTCFSTFHQYVTNPTAAEINVTSVNGTEVDDSKSSVSFNSLISRLMYVVPYVALNEVKDTLR